MWLNFIVWKFKKKAEDHIDGLAQDCSNSSPLGMELLLSCTKLSVLDFVMQSAVISYTKI